MPSFDMCCDNKCRRRKTCLRFIAKPDVFQWYMDSQSQDSKCNYYIARVKPTKLEEVIYSRMKELDQNPSNTVSWKTVRRTNELDMEA